MGAGQHMNRILFGKKKCICNILGEKKPKRKYSEMSAVVTSCGGIKDFYTFMFYTKHVLVM